MGPRGLEYRLFRGRRFVSGASERCPGNGPSFRRCIGPAEYATHKCLARGMVPGVFGTSHTCRVALCPRFRSISGVLAASGYGVQRKIRWTRWKTSLTPDRSSGLGRGGYKRTTRFLSAFAPRNDSSSGGFDCHQGPDVQVLFAPSKIIGQCCRTG